MVNQQGPFSLRTTLWYLEKVKSFREKFGPQEEVYHPDNLCN